MARVAQRDPAARKAYQQTGAMPDLAALAQRMAALRLTPASAVPELEPVTTGQSVKET